VLLSVVQERWLYYSPYGRGPGMPYEAGRLLTHQGEVPWSDLYAAHTAHRRAGRRVGRQAGQCHPDGSQSVPQQHFPTVLSEPWAPWEAHFGVSRIVL